MLLKMLTGLSLCTAVGAFADESSAPRMEPQQEIDQQRICEAPEQLTLSHHFGKGVGHKGYTSADLFFTRVYDSSFSPFLDLRFHVMDQGRIALNSGIGFRTLLGEDKCSMGANLYYDYRNSSHLHTSQIAGGIEVLSPYVDFRLNGYFPFDDRKYVGAEKVVKFVGHQANTRRTSYDAFSSANAEFGIPLPWIAPKYIETYVGVGPYYLFGTSYPDSWGGKLRLAANCTDYFSLEVDVNYDRIFHTTCQAVVAFNIPLYKKKACRGNSSSKAKDAFFKRSLRPVMRNEIIPVKKKTKNSLLKDQNGDIIQFYFVNNLSSCPGVGTFESPFCTLAGAAAAPSGPVVVYVFEGNGSPYTGGFVMKPGQTLQGSALPLTINGVTIAPFTSHNPILSNAAGSTVTLASSTTVQGLTIQGAAGFNGISGSSVNHVSILNNIIDGGTNGIDITSDGGPVRIAGNLIRNSSSVGLAVTINQPGLVEVIGNSSLHYGLSGIYVTIAHPDAVGAIFGNVLNTSLAAGYDINTEVQEGALSIDTNQITSQSQFGIHAGNGKQFIANNIIVNSDTSGGNAAIGYVVFGAQASPAEAFIYNNVTNLTPTNTGFGIVVQTQVAGDAYVELQGNSVTKAHPSTGIAIQASLGPICASLLGNSSSTTINLTGTVPLSLQQTQAQYESSNTAPGGFTYAGTIQYGSSCTAP